MRAKSRFCVPALLKVWVLLTKLWNFALNELVVPPLSWWERLLSTDLLGARCLSGWSCGHFSQMLQLLRLCRAIQHWLSTSRFLNPPFLFKKHFSVSCTFCFVAYFYLRQQSSSCGRRDTGTCLLELVDAGCWVGIQIRGMQEELQSWRCPSELEQTKSPGNWAPPLVLGKKAWWMVKNHFS